MSKPAEKSLKLVFTTLLLQLTTQQDILSQTVKFALTNFDKLSPSYKITSNLIPLENIKEDTYEIIIGMENFSPLKLNFSVFTLSKDFNSAVLKKSIEFPSTYAYSADFYQDNPVVGKYVILVQHYVFAWNVVDVEDNNLVVWNFLQYPAKDKKIGTIISGIENTNRFLVGGHRTSQLGEPNNVYLLDITDINFVKRFKVETINISFWSFYTPNLQDPFFLVSAVVNGSPNYNKWGYYDITKDYSPSSPTHQSQNNYLNEFNFEVLFCRSEGPDKSFFWATKQNLKKIVVLKWGSFPVIKVTEDDLSLRFTDYPSLKLISLVSIQNTKYMVAMSTLINSVRGFFFSEVDNLTKTTLVVKSDGNNQQFIRFFRNIKLSMQGYTSTYPNYEVRFNLLDPVYYKCSDAFSLECDEIKPNITTSCLDTAYLRTGNTTCSCKVGYRTLADTCDPCKIPAYECDGFGDTGSVRCRTGYYVDPETRCLNCSTAEDVPGGCPQPLNLGVNKFEIDELDKKFEILLNISFKDVIEQFGNQGDSFEKNVSISNFLLVEKEEVLLGNQSIGVNYGYEFFKEENITKIVVTVKEDLKAKEKAKIHLTTNPGTIYEKDFIPNSFFFYIKNNKVSIQVINEASNRIKKSANRTFTFIWLFIIISLIAGFLIKKKLSTFIFLIKYFQILDIISNFGKINIHFQMAIRMALEFIDELSFPTLKFIEKMSVIKDHEDQKFQDIYAYKFYRRGKRGKVTSSNEDLFLFQGSFFFYSMLLVSTFFLIKFFSCCKSENKIFSWVKKSIIWVHFFILGILFFDLQFVGINEIGIHDIAIRQPGKYKWSYIFSSLLISISIYYCGISYKLIQKIKFMFEENKNENRKETEKKSKEDEDEKDFNILEKKLTQHAKDETQSYLIIRFFTEELSEEAIKEGSLTVILDNYRFFLIQALISGLQLHQLSQILLIFIANSGFFILYLAKFSKLKGKNKSIYLNKLVLIKCFTKEICIEIFLALCFIIGLLEKNEVDYKEKSYYAFGEFIAIASIIVAVLGEFLMMMVPVYKLLKKIILKTFKRKKSNINKIENFGETERKVLNQIGVEERDESKNLKNFVKKKSKEKNDEKKGKNIGKNKVKEKNNENMMKKKNDEENKRKFSRMEKGVKLPKRRKVKQSKVKIRNY